MHGGVFAEAYNVLQDRKTTVEVWKRKSTFYLVDQKDLKLYVYQNINSLKSEWYIRLKGNNND